MSTKNYRSLPRGANGLETRYADALGDRIELLRNALDDPTLSDEEREEYEHELFAAAQQLRTLRNAVYDRLTDE